MIIVEEIKKLFDGENISITNEKGEEVPFSAASLAATVEAISIQRNRLIIKVSKIPKMIREGNILCERAKKIILEAAEMSAEVYLQKDGQLQVERIWEGEIPKEWIKNALQSKNARESFEYSVFEAFNDYDCDLIYEIAVDAFHRLKCEGFYVADDDIEYIRDFLWDEISFSYPTEDLLKQRVPVNIQIDTGDSNFDFVLNQEPQHEERKKASLLWLAKTQGYSVEETEKALEEEEKETPEGFLETLNQEVIENTSSIGILTFLVEMPIRDLFTIQGKIDRIVLDSSSTVGLFDPCSGAGGFFDISLEKDVEIPKEIIFDVSPDWNTHYSVEETYGFLRSVWKPSLKEIWS